MADHVAKRVRDNHKGSRKARRRKKGIPGGSRIGKHISRQRRLMFERERRACGSGDQRLE